MISLKGNQIIIRTEKDAKEIDSKLALIEIQYIPFVVFTLTTLLNQLIIDPIQTKMRRAGISEKVINRTYLDTKASQQDRTITFYVISDYISESGFPVAVMIENGRKAYFINQKEKRMTWLKDGIRKWAKRYPEGIGVKIPVKAASNIIFDTIQEGQPKVQAELNSKTRQWLKSSLRN